MQRIVPVLNNILRYNSFAAKIIFYLLLYKKQRYVSHVTADIIIVKLIYKLRYVEVSSNRLKEDIII